MIAITISGLPIRTNSDSTMEEVISSPRVEKSSLEPRSMKKNSSRKSRMLVSRALIASRYAVEASEKPAMKAPASLLKPANSPSAASAVPQAMAKISSSSCERARVPTIRGSR